jgi:hypothetical protein
MNWFKKASSEEFYGFLDQNGDTVSVSRITGHRHYLEQMQKEGKLDSQDAEQYVRLLISSSYFVVNPYSKLNAKQVSVIKTKVFDWAKENYMSSSGISYEEGYQEFRNMASWRSSEVPLYVALHQFVQFLSANSVA